jgi:hypothetical protein
MLDLGSAVSHRISVLHQAEAPYPRSPGSSTDLSTRPGTCSPRLATARDATGAVAAAQATMALTGHFEPPRGGDGLTRAAGHSVTVTLPS